MEEKDLMQLKKEIKVSKAISIMSLIINVCLLCVLAIVSAKALSIANEVKPTVEKVSTIDTATINEAVIKLNKTIEQVDWNMVSDKISQLDVENLNNKIKSLDVSTINNKLEKLDVDMIQAKLRELDIQTLNKKINEMDMEEFSKAAENLNKAIERIKNPFGKNKN